MRRPSRPRTSTAWVVLAAGMMSLATIAGTGCAPSIQAFNAEPNVTCRGVPVRLSWTASNGGHLSASPVDPALGSVDPAGAKMVTPAVTTTYRLHAQRLGRETVRDVDVEVVNPPAQPMTIAVSVADPSTTCENATLAATITAPTADWNPHVTAARIQLPESVNRPYHVDHAGHTADLLPGAPSTAFQDVPVVGAWRVSTPLQTGEACGRKGPRSLLLDVYATCGP